MKGFQNTVLAYKLEIFQLSGALPETLTLSLPWCEVYLTAPLPLLRYHTATLLGIASRSSDDQQLVDSWGERVLKLLNDKVSELTNELQNLTVGLIRYPPLSL